MEVNDVWLAYNGIKPKEKWLNTLPYWDEKGNYINYKTGDVVPLLERCLRRGYYQITSIELPGIWYDATGFDDGRKYNFRFHHSEVI